MDHAELLDQKGGQYSWNLFAYYLLVFVRMRLPVISKEREI